MIEILKITSTYNPYWFKMETIEGLMLIHLDDLNIHKFIKGSQINNETFHLLYLSYLTRKAKEKILRKLAAKQKSKKEIKQAISEILYKLNKEKHKSITAKEADTIQTTITTYLEENNYLNDYRYGENLVNKYISSNKPKGIRFIKSALSAKGLSHDDILKLTENLSENTHEIELKNALVLMEKLSKRHKYRTSEPAKQKAMVLRYLVSQGYDFDISMQALKEYL